MRGISRSQCQFLVLCPSFQGDSMSKLAVVQISNVKPKGKAYKFTDGHYMHIHVSPTGKKSWRNIIQPPTVFSYFVQFELRGALEIAAKVLQRMKAVFRYAVQVVRVTSNPVAEMNGGDKK